MTNAAGLDANAYLSLTRRSDGPFYEVQSPGFRYFDRPIRFSHLRLLSVYKTDLSSFTVIFEKRQFPSRLSWLSRENSPWSLDEFVTKDGKSRFLRSRALPRLGAHPNARPATHP